MNEQNRASDHYGFDWNRFSERGKVEQKLKNALNDVKESFLNKKWEKNGIESCGKSVETLPPMLRSSLNKEFDQVISQFSLFTQNEIKLKKQKFYREVRREFDLRVNKGALCIIEFDGYALYRFFKALSSLLYEMEIEIRDGGLYALTMDPLRIAIIELSLTNDSFVFYEKGKVGINLDDLQKALKCERSEKMNTKLVMTRNTVDIIMKSRKARLNRDNIIQTIDYHPVGGLNISLLRDSPAQYQFSLEEEDLGLIVEKLGKYSQVFTIKCDDESISFSEEGQGKINEIKFQIKKLSNFSTNLNKIFLYKRFFSLQYLTTAHSLLSLSSRKKSIMFWLNFDNPLKIKIKFKEFGGSDVLLYISPRKEKIDGKN